MKIALLTIERFDIQLLSFNQIPLIALKLDAHLGIKWNNFNSFVIYYANSIMLTLRNLIYNLFSWLIFEY